MTNLIPAWDKDGLRPRDKIEVHRRGLKHPAVSVFLFRGEAMLLQRRALGKYHTPGLWANACCTHPRWGEAPADCAARRLGEELGLQGLSPDHRGRIEYRADVGGGMVEHEVVDLFAAELPEAMALRPDPAEVMDTRWADPGALAADLAAAPSLFTPWLRIYIAEHGGRIRA